MATLLTPMDLTGNAYLAACGATLGFCDPFRRSWKGSSQSENGGFWDAPALEQSHPMGRQFEHHSGDVELGN